WSAPLRREGEPVGVVTLEWDEHESAGEGSETFPGARLRLLAELATPLLAQLYDRDRNPLVKLRDGTRRTASAVLGTQYTWAKLAVVGVLAGGLWVTLGRGTDHVKATFVVEATQRQLVTAPFAGYLEAVHVEPGEVVEAGATVLAELDTSELRLEAAQLRAKEAESRKHAEMARSERNMAEVQMALSEAAATAAERELVERRIAQASLTSGLGGAVVRGDLKRELGRAVTEGETLFEVAPTESLRAELFVPEERAGDLFVGMEGELATTTYPDQRVRFVVERIEPAARVHEGRNVFVAEVALAVRPAWLRPGMTGAARLEAGEDRYVVLWTRDAVNWVRMKLWL
ncbi:MAG: HlyD family efflux transporter periplasmic adaptor subunit, partial [Planctomycetota bacterium]